MSFPSLRVLGSVGVVALALVVTGAGGRRLAVAGTPEVAPALGEISSATTAVTVYGATWCGPCKHLEAELTRREITFALVDVDRDQEAYARARTASGMGPGIPLTNIARDTPRWVQGDNADAVERACKGD